MKTLNWIAATTALAEMTLVVAALAGNSQGAIADADAMLVCAVASGFALYAVLAMDRCR